jgi:hypothetical protein
MLISTFCCLMILTSSMMLKIRKKLRNRFMLKGLFLFLKIKLRGLGNLLKSKFTMSIWIRKKYKAIHFLSKIKNIEQAMPYQILET